MKRIIQIGILFTVTSTRLTVQLDNYWKVSFNDATSMLSGAV